LSFVFNYVKLITFVIDYNTTLATTTTVTSYDYAVYQKPDPLNHLGLTSSKQAGY